MTSPNPKGPPIAIVGIAAQLPSGKHSEDNLDRHTFWQFLLDKKEAYESLPHERSQQLSGNIISAGGTFLKGTTKFDNVEFGASNKDSASMTASTRRLIELGFLAMLDAGIDSRGQKIGTFFAGTNAEYFEGDDIGARSFGLAVNTQANRVAYTLNLTGPSLYLDTACSSTLTAMHLALRSIENGDCEAALVGGCQHNMNFWDWMSYIDGGILTTDNKCKPFDESADGFLKGEGAGVVVIKPLEAALADNDHIYAVILGSAINSNGARAPLHAPSGIAQQECIRAAYAQAGRDPKDVDFVECHATGTAVGDPIEANAAGEVFARNDEVLIGSVKGNLGHLEISAFFTSLLKMCLILENKVIPPNVHLNNRNSRIMWEKYNLKVPTEATPLGCRSTSGKSLVSLASSGIGGSNGHVVLESAPDLDPPATLLPDDIPVLFVVGGLSPRATQEITISLLELLSKDSSKEALSQAVTHARRARQLPWRSYFVYTPGSSTTPHVEGPVLIPKARPPVVFVFTGQGPQHFAMGRHLFASHHVFRQSILEMDQIFKARTGASLIETTGLFDSRYPSTLPAVWSVEITIPSMTILQIALFDLLLSVGVKPDVLVGHSAGETPMIYASGAGSKAMAVEVAIARGRAMKLTEPLGAGMAAVACGAVRTTALIERVKSEGEGVLEIACHNSPDAVVVSGSSHLVDKAIELAQAENIFARRVQTLNPAHTSLMDACRAEYESGMKDIFARYEGTHKPNIPCYSTVSGHGKFIEDFNAEYCWSNIRRPVHYHQAVSSILNDYPTAAFLEVSPHPTLSSYIVSLGVPSNMITCPLRRPSKKSSASNLEITSFAESLGVLTTLGLNTIDLSALYGRASRDLSYNIPYPFTTRHFPMRFDGPREPSAANGSACALRTKMNAKTFPDLAEHVINGEKIAPAACLIDMVLQTGAKMIWDLQFQSILSLSSDVPVEARVEQDGSRWSLNTLHKNADASQPKDVRVHSTGFSSNNSPEEPEYFDIQAVLSRLSPVDCSDFYESLKPMIEFGPVFQRLSSLFGDSNEAIAEISTVLENEGSKDYVFNPVILDACLHWALHPLLLQNTEAGVIFLPSKLRKFTFYGSPKPYKSVYSHFKLREWTPDTRVADMTVYTKEGIILCKMQKLELRKVPSAPRTVKVRYGLHLQPVVSCQPLPRCETGWTRDERDMFIAANVTLDHLAVNIIKESLAGDLVVGDELNRQRYWNFAKAATQRKLPPLSEPSVISEIKSRWPLFFEITDRLSVVHKDVFRSSAPVVQALYSDDLMTAYYDINNGFFGPACERAVTMFTDNITSLYRQGKRVIRVLEVGAGTGLLTRLLCNALKGREEIDLVVEFVVSDISLALASVAAKTTSYEYSVAKAYDLTEPLEEQGMLPGSFDIVCGLHVLHAVSEISPALSSIHRLLVAGGSILIVELNGDGWCVGRPGALWHDFVFGGFAEWFGFADGREHCCQSPEQWESFLLREGYEDVQTSVEKDCSMEFIFTAQKPHAVPSSNLRLDLPAPVFLTYQYGHEMALQKDILELDVNQQLTLWILAGAGVDGDAGVGLVQSLWWEYSAWEVHLAIFEDRDDEQDRIDTILRYREYLTQDTVSYFRKDGTPYVPKVVPCNPPPPPASNLLDPFGGWVETDLGLVSVQPPVLKEYQVLVDVLSLSNSYASWRGFVGSVIDSRNPKLESGSFVVGICQTGVTNRIVCHSGQVIPLAVVNDQLAEHALGLVIAALALGPSRLSEADSALPPLRLLIAAEDEVSWALHDVLVALPSLARVEIGGASDDARFDLIIADSTTIAARPEVSFWHGKLFIWDRLIGEGLERDPWSISYLLKSALRLADTSQFPKALSLTYPQEKAISVCMPSGPLFNPKKSYVLIGGASDLGLQVALWMYQHGARNIVLTSRRGRLFFEASKFTPTKQRLSYLDSRDDLSLRVEACDAVSLEATSYLIKSLKTPLGGCFLMTLVLADQLFMHQTEDSFRRVCDAKVKALETFQKAFPIETLDFFVFFSSTVAVLGNFGQANYAAANNAVEGRLAEYPNAFSIAIPGITNVGYLARVQDTADSDTYKKFDRWSTTPEELCTWIEDGLLKMWRTSKAEHCPRYIPDISWNVIHQDLGLSTSTRHLVLRNDSEGSDRNQERSGIIDTVLALLDVATSDFDPHVPFTAYGLDSLNATRISEAIRPWINVSQMQLLGGMTWAELEEKIFADVEKTENEADDSLTAPMMRMLSKYCQDFPVFQPSVLATIPQLGDHILVTGTTGSIGSAVLAELILDDKVHQIYAVNRRSKDTANLQQRQKSAFDTRGMDPTMAESSKLILLEGDLSMPDLGLDSKVLQKIRSSVTHVIHISWMVNWTMGLDAFEPNISGLRHLVDLALSSSLPSPPRLLFASSVSAIHRHAANTEAMPERFTEPELAVYKGYSESKWVAEQILKIVASETPLRPLVLRIGQVSGGLNGMWNSNEWIPGIIQSAKRVRCLPSLEPRVSWLPLEIAAKSVVDARNSSAPLIQLAHPKPVSWNSLFKRIASKLDVPLVPWSQWLTRLEGELKVPKDRDTSCSDPSALLLVDLYRQIPLHTDPEAEAVTPRMCTEVAVREIPSLSTARQLSAEDVDRWLFYWRSTGFLSF